MRAHIFKYNSLIVATSAAASDPGAAAADADMREDMKSMLVLMLNCIGFRSTYTHFAPASWVVMFD